MRAHLPGVTPTANATTKVSGTPSLEHRYPWTVPDQTMKPATAAKKLGVYLPATPAEFQDGTVSRTVFLELQTNPPEWLVGLRLNGPHPRSVVAQKLGVSASGLARADAPDVLTTAEIKALLQEMPEWLVVERATHAAVNEENARVKTERAAREQQRAAGDGGRGRSGAANPGPGSAGSGNRGR